MMRTVLTEASVWKFDLDSMMFVRFPRNEDPRGGRIPYTCEWEPFEALYQHDDHLDVIRPVPLGQGQVRETGVVLADTHPELVAIPPLDDDAA